MKIFVDTNVILSAFLWKGTVHTVFNRILENHEAVISEGVLAEATTVLARKFSFSASDIGLFERYLRETCTVVPTVTSVAINVRDVADVPILASALAVDASILVTGDMDLLSLVDTVSEISILNPSQLLEELLKNN